MKILVVLTYYRPHTSGLTIYAERLAKAMVKDGHQVTILTSQYDRQLPREETIKGVRIIRVPVLMRISKGVVMPSFGWFATKLAWDHDMINLHLPQLDAAGIALRGRILKKPTVITYHCDLQMPRGLLSWVANQGVNLMNFFAALLSHKIVAYTEDYATHSRLLKRFFQKIEIINPPVELPIVDEEKQINFPISLMENKKNRIIGMAARFATEKGVEVLIAAVEKLIKNDPGLQVWFAGPYKNILGEEKYFERLSPRIKQLEKSNHWKFLGILNPEQMAFFYQKIDLLVLPSLNSTESFGLVQIEAMMFGKPVITSNLPGVRQPILRHQMGRVIPIGDAKALAVSIIEILKNKENFQINHDELIKEYSPEKIAEDYIELFSRINFELKPGKTPLPH